MFTCEIIENRNREYDHYIISHPYGHLFQSSAWGEFKRFYGWQPIRLLIRSRSLITASVSLLNHQLFNNYTFLYAPRGPVMHFDSSQLLDFLLDKIAGIADTTNAVFLKIDPALPKIAGKAKTRLVEKGFKQIWGGKPQKSLQLAQVYRIHLPYQNKSHITLIKSMGKLNKLTVEHTTSMEKLKLFYALLLEYGELTDVKVRAFDYYLRMWQLMEEFGVHLFLIRQKNYVIGASLLVSFGPTCYSLYTVYRQRHLGLYPESFLHLAIMEWAAAAGYKNYEIMDTLLTTKQTSGDTRLFSFPVEPYTYLGEFDLVYRPWQYQLWNLLFPVYNWSVKN